MNEYLQNTLNKKDDVFSSMETQFATIEHDIEELEKYFQDKKIIIPYIWFAYEDNDWKNENVYIRWIIDKKEWRLMYHKSGSSCIPLTSVSLPIKHKIYKFLPAFIKDFAKFLDRRKKKPNFRKKYEKKENPEIVLDESLEGNPQKMEHVVSGS